MTEVLSPIDLIAQEHGQTANQFINDHGITIYRQVNGSEAIEEMQQELQDDFGSNVVIDPYRKRSANLRVYLLDEKESASAIAVARQLNNYEMDSDILAKFLRYKIPLRVRKPLTPTIEEFLVKRSYQAIAKGLVGDVSPKLAGQRLFRERSLIVTIINHALEHEPTWLPFFSDLPIAGVKDEETGKAVHERRLKHPVRLPLGEMVILQRNKEPW